MKFGEGRLRNKSHAKTWFVIDKATILILALTALTTMLFVLFYQMPGEEFDSAKDGFPEITEIADKNPPQIIGAKDVYLVVDSNYDFMKDVTVQDDRDKNPVIDVDYSGVNFQEAGTYKATYKAHDKNGNETTQGITVFVDPKLPSGSGIVYLTFDDGPSKYTPELLEILKQNDVKATFFVTGRYDSDMFKKIVADGHAIGLHTNSHNYSIYSSEDAFFSDLTAIEDKIAAQVGFRPKIMRFAGGSSNTISKKYSRGIMTRLTAAVHERGYKYYDWNCITGDGIAGATVSSEINDVRQCSGTIYLLAHDTIPQTIEAMRTIIPMLKNRGYQFEVITPDTPELHHNTVN